jgi:uroporphyrinogen decarboxylase
MGHGLGHRERVLRAIEHQDLDRVPCCFRAEADVEARLVRELGLSSRLDITRFFDADTVELNAYLEPPDLARVETVEDVDRLSWPDRGSVDVGTYVADVRELRGTGLAVLAGAWASIFTGPRRTMGEARYLMAMLDHPDLIARITQRMTESYLDLNEAVFSQCADCIDVFYFGSDFGSQRSLFISRDAFARFFEPHMTRLAQHAKGFGLKVMFHTCGAVAAIIPDLIECGIDMLDPVQVSAHGMQPETLALDFRGRIAFHGGISTQTTLPHGTPEQVRHEVRRAIASLGPTGYICGPDQNMMADTPTGNMVAMYEAIREYAPS